MGRPLAAVVDVFGLWRLKFGEDSSLLSMLAFQAIDESDSAGGLKGLHAQTTGSSWRVGVHQPVQHDEDIVEHARHLAVGAGLHDVQVHIGACIIYVTIDAIGHGLQLLLLPTWVCRAAF